MPASTRERELARGLADAGEHDLLRRNAGRERALQLAARHHVGAGAEPRQRRDHRLVGIRLHGVADERRHVGEGLGEDAVVPLERRGRIAIERRADGLRRAREIDLLGVQHAVAIGEMVHGDSSVAASRAASRSSMSGFLLAPAGAIGRPCGSRARSAVCGVVATTAPAAHRAARCRAAGRQRQAERQRSARRSRARRDASTVEIGSRCTPPNAATHTTDRRAASERQSRLAASLPRKRYFLPSLFSHFVGLAPHIRGRGAAIAGPALRPSARPTARRTPPW